MSEKQEAITILLADDHHVVRQGLRTLLEAQPNFSVLGEAADGLEVAGLVEALRPNVLIVDLMMPGLNGLDITEQVKQRSPGTRVIILSMYANEGYVIEAFEKGAVGYVVKDSSAADLVQAVQHAHADRRYLSPPLSDLKLETYLEKAKAAKTDDYETLTAREREVLHLVAEGYTSAEIADRLVISPRTVETHRSNLMRKLDLNSQTDLVRYALRRGIVSLEE